MDSKKAKVTSNNKERILDAAIELMNQHGGAVGTSQIASHLDISPGNLYYHFRNREGIMRELFQQLTDELLEVLHAEPGEPIPAERLAACFTGGARVLWRYRFFFAVDFIRRDEALAEEYRALSRQSKAYMRNIIESALKMAPGQCSASTEDHQRLAENMWVLWISWPRYTEMDCRGGVVREADIWRGLEQISFVLAPYLSQDYYQETTRQLHHFATTLAQQPV